MSIRLICDQCGQGQQDPHGRWLVEIRGVTANDAQAITRSDHPMGQVHWECIGAFVERKSAEAEEVPF